jgi:hypothetical protein
MLKASAESWGNYWIQFSRHFYRTPSFFWLYQFYELNKRRVDFLSLFIHHPANQLLNRQQWLQCRIPEAIVTFITESNRLKLVLLKRIQDLEKRVIHWLDGT